MGPSTVTFVTTFFLTVVFDLTARASAKALPDWAKSAATQNAVVRLGQAGYVARGVVVVGIGIAALDAAITYNAARAEGVDGALRSFAQTAFGPWLLILIALGLIAFGILSFLEAKWRRTLGGVPV